MFFFYIILILFIILIFIYFTTIKIHIQNVKFSTDKRNGRHLNKDYKIEIKLYLFEKIRYFKLDITKTKMERKKLQEGVDKIQKKINKNEKDFDTRALKSLKYLDLSIDKIDFSLNIGLEDAAVCAMCIGVASTVVSMILKKMMKESNNNSWSIMPVYQNRNLLNIKLDCILKLKLTHILYTLYYFQKLNKKYV